MLEAAKRNDRLLMVGFCCRFENAADIIRTQQETDFFGEIYYAKASYLRRNGAPGGWFCNTAMSGGGPMIDLGVHILDLTRYLMGNPKPVSVFGATFNKLGDRPGVHKPTDAYLCADNNDICDVEDLATAMIRYDNGAVLFLESSYSLNIKDTLYSMELFGTKGGVKIAPDFEMYKDINGYMMDMTPAGYASTSPPASPVRSGISSTQFSEEPSAELRLRTGLTFSAYLWRFTNRRAPDTKSCCDENLSEKALVGRRVAVRPDYRDKRRHHNRYRGISDRGHTDRVPDARTYRQPHSRRGRDLGH